MIDSTIVFILGVFYEVEVTNYHPRPLHGVVDGGKFPQECWFPRIIMRPIYSSQGPGVSPSHRLETRHAGEFSYRDVTDGVGL